MSSFRSNQFIQSLDIRIFKDFKKHFLKDEVVNLIFNNLRNLTYSVLPLAAAKISWGNFHEQYSVFAYIVVIFFLMLSLFLMLLNVMHGFQKIIKIKAPKCVFIIIIAVYVFAVSLIFVSLSYKA